MAKRSRTSDLQWVRPGLQDRSRRTHAALLDAAATLFAERGAEATTLADIAERAGYSIGAIYHHFQDKKAVQHALFDQLAEEFEATAREATAPERWTGAGVAEILRGYLQFSLENARARPGLRQAGLEITRTEPELLDRYNRAREVFDQWLTELLLARRDEIGHQQPELAVAYILEQLGAMLRARTGEPPLATRFGNQSDAAFVAETMRSVCGYLEIPDPGES